MLARLEFATDVCDRATHPAAQGQLQVSCLVREPGFANAIYIYICIYIYMCIYIYIYD